MRCIYCGAMVPEKAGTSGKGEKTGKSQEQGRFRVTEWKDTHILGDRPGERDDRVLITETPDRDIEETPVIPFAMEKSRSPKPMNRVVLVLIFFASAAFMGALVWLLG
jgi:hypothetical protein